MFQEGVGHLAERGIPVHAAVAIDLVRDPAGDAHDFALDRVGRAARRHQQLPQFLVPVFPALAARNDGRLSIVADAARNWWHVEQCVHLAERGAGFVHEFRVEVGAMELEFRADARDLCLHLGCLPGSGVEQYPGHLHGTLQVGVAAVLEQVRQRRLAIGVERLDVCSVSYQFFGNAGITGPRRRMQRRAAPIFAGIHIGAQLEQHIDTCAPISRA